MSTSSGELTSTMTKTGSFTKRLKTWEELEHDFGGEVGGDASLMATSVALIFGPVLYLKQGELSRQTRCEGGRHGPSYDSLASVHFAAKAVKSPASMSRAFAAE